MAPKIIPVDILEGILSFLFSSIEFRFTSLRIPASNHELTNDPYLINPV